MPRVTVVQVIYNHRRFIEPVFSAIFAQSYKDFNVVAVIAGNNDNGKQLLMEKFPQVEIIDPGYNIGFAKGHNLAFKKYGAPTRPSTGSGHPVPAGVGSNEKAADFFQLVNPDLVLEPTYIENIVKAFDDPKVGAATGKLFCYDFGKHKKTNILDSTGVVISKSGRARDRGQHEPDNHQYDGNRTVQAVSAAAAMYRTGALESVRLPAIRYPLSADFEYFDEDFHSYWEDVDLSWRMSNVGWNNAYVPSAIAYHGRGASSSRGGYLRVIEFIGHHRALDPRVRQLNYQNHIFMYIKNSRRLYPQFFAREFFMLMYILFFEISTFKILPQMFKLFPKIWSKRKLIRRKAHVG